MKLELSVYPDPVLALRAKEIEEITPEIRQLVKDMAETMYANEGIGLAAPQVGQSIRLVLIDLTGPEKREDMRVLINPVITARSDDTVETEEGCLSVAALRAKVRRAAEVSVQATDLDGNPVSIEADELMAVCLQHELDHLDGTLFIDHISRLKRTLYDKKVKKWMRQQEKADSALKIVFMGTPEFARISLEHLHAFDGAEVVAVYTQPDRPCGRGRACKPSDVKRYAAKQGIPVLQPENFKSPETVAELAALAPDLLVVTAYGLILPQSVLDIPRLGAINVHASLLPKYRGAAPIQRAILAGETSTGISIMRMDAGMDTGDILYARSMTIGMNDTAETLHDDLADMGGRMLVEALERLVENRLVRVRQDDSLATYAAKLEKSEGELDWSLPAQEVHDRARAMHPWPGAYFTWGGGRTGKPLRLVVTPGRVGFDLDESRPEPGSILGICDGMLAIACADKAYLIPSVKPAGRKLLAAEAFACGYLDDCPGIVCPMGGDTD